MKASRSKPNSTSEIAMFSRLIQADDGNLDPRLARYVLTLGFPASDQKRMSDLASRNQEGRLSTAESDELHSYVRSGHLLALLHSKARKSLKTRRAS
jgi:hypothetical protein